jgi:hypothetical protein
MILYYIILVISAIGCTHLKLNQGGEVICLYISRNAKTYGEL